MKENIGASPDGDRAGGRADPSQQAVSAEGAHPLRKPKTPQDILRRRALEYHQRGDRGPSCGSMAIDMDLIFSGYVRIGDDALLHVTESGQAFLREHESASLTTGEPEHHLSSEQKVRRWRRSRPYGSAASDGSGDT